MSLQLEGNIGGRTDYLIGVLCLALGASREHCLLIACCHISAIPPQTLGFLQLWFSCFFRFGITSKRADISQLSLDAVPFRLDLAPHWALIGDNGASLACLVQLSCVRLLGHSSNMRLQYATAYRGCDEEIVRFSRIVLEISSDTVAAASLRPKSQSAQQS